MRMKFLRVWDKRRLFLEIAHIGRAGGLRLPVMQGTRAFAGAGQQGGGRRTGSESARATVPWPRNATVFDACVLCTAQVFSR